MSLRALTRGAAAGAVATVAHTAVMATAARHGRLGEPPPKKITRAALKRVAPEAAREPLTVWVATAASHLAFGAATGVAYALLHPEPRPTLSSGLRFGSFVWLASYAGWVPALGIMPMPANDKRGRPSAMLAAHWAFGATLVMTLRALRA
ncbi:MAG: hypothetical protein J0L92_12065 [Deltaproteobacteria bacterium]|nr:hypothetical protein [Deltaproteobacteria bacterium]